MTTLNERVQEAVSLLKNHAGYTRRGIPLHIADIDYSFGFDAVLEGPGEERNLVLVCAPIDIPTVAIERRIRALSIGLRRSGSTRPIILVLVLDQPDEVAAIRLQALCRVIAMLPTADIQVALAPLMPLPLPAQSDTIVSVIDALKEELLEQPGDTRIVSDLIRAATVDSSTVEKAILSALYEAASIDRNGKEPT